MMAYNDKRLKTDLEGKPIPQAYNPAIDDYEPVHSTNNALNQVIYGPNGQPISTVGNKLAVRATELEALMQGLATEGKLEQVRQLLAGVATENKLEQARTLLDAISTKDFATSSKQDALNIAVEDLKSELNLVKSELANIKANQLSGDQKVQQVGTVMELYGATIADRPPANTVLVGATFTIVDESGYFQTWISDGTKWVEV